MVSFNKPDTYSKEWDLLCPDPSTDCRTNQLSKVLKSSAGPGFLSYSVTYAHYELLVCCPYNSKGQERRKDLTVQ